MRFIPQYYAATRTIVDMKDSTTRPLPSAQDVIGACPHDCPDTCSLITTVHNGMTFDKALVEFLAQRQSRF